MTAPPTVKVHVAVLYLTDQPTVVNITLNVQDVYPPPLQRIEPRSRGVVKGVSTNLAGYRA